MPELLLLQVSEVFDHFGVFLGSAVLIIGSMASVVIFLDRRSDRLYALRLHEQEVQYEARLKDQKESYEARLEDYERLAQFHQALLRRGVEIQDTTIKELGPRSR
jgi:hypothetical protein